VARYLERSWDYVYSVPFGKVYGLCIASYGGEAGRKSVAPLQTVPRPDIWHLPRASTITRVEDHERRIFHASDFRKHIA
jgi:hypothetical protein